MAESTQLTKSDFETNQEVRWCPGCGDYSILAAVQRFLPTLGIPREKFVFVSGIGCSSRFPYYMNTYGFHSIHGRAPAVATGIKVSNPELSVWIATGDGDALSIGGNHFMHLMRKNPDINILLFNNRIYGLTKGQYSPTSEFGKITKSTPAGSPDRPLNPALLALGAQATFVARAIDVDAKLLADVLKEAAAHKGTSFVEIYQNCNIFNDGAFLNISERAVRSEAQIHLEQGKPLIFGEKRNKGLRLKDSKWDVIEFEPNSPQSQEVTVFDVHNELLATALARLEGPPHFPLPVGVLFMTEAPVCEAVIAEQRQVALVKNPPKASVDENLSALFRSGETWLVE